MKPPYRHISTPYELAAAAEGRLKAIVMPATGGWVEGDPRGWPAEGLECGFEVGDRIYLAEEWARLGAVLSDEFDFAPDAALSRSSYYKQGWSDDDYAAMDGFLPAETMPLEASQYQYAIALVRICKMLQITEFFRSGLLCSADPLNEQGYSNIKTAHERWNAAQPDCPWHVNRWVIVLKLEIS